MRKTKVLLTVVILAVTLSAGAGSAAFAQPGQQQLGTEPLIAGGTVVSEGSYPFVAALLDTRKGGDEVNQQFCGGSLIHRSYVLTAAHCVDPRGNTNVWTLQNWHLMNVVVGRTGLTGTGGQVRVVHHVYIPSGWNPTATQPRLDVALLQLSGPGVEGITPVRLPPSTDNWYEQPGKKMRIAGWGRSVETDPGTKSNDLRAAEVLTVSDAEAQTILQPYFDPETMIAAGMRGAGPCVADSGGPLFASYIKLGKRPPGTPPSPPYQYGIFSNFTECGGTKYPEYYTEVNHPGIRSWIMGRIGQ